MSNQSMYAMYVIGQVESNHNWAAVNYNDPITLGMMQWYGQRAQGLIVHCALADSAGFQQFQKEAPVLAQQAHDNYVPGGWSSRVVTQAEGNAWAHWATRKENHAGQQSQWEEDYKTYSVVCDNYGIPPTNMRERILFMTAYHQSPLQASHVINSVGSMANLERLLSGILADPVLSGYPNRYNTAYSLLKNWDGNAAPPDFGQDTGGGSPAAPTGGNAAPPVKPKPPEKVTVNQLNDALVVHVGDKVYTAFPGAAQTWIAQSGAGKPIVSGSTGGGTPAPPSTDPGSGNSDNAKKIDDWIRSREGKFAYSQGGGRLNPDQSGYTDCSGLIWSAYHFAIGMDIGTWTGAEAGRGRRVAISSAQSVQQAIDLSQPGDILLITWSGHNPSYDHEEFISIDKNWVWSHGGPGNGPHGFKTAEQMQYASEWEVRREL